MPNNDPVTQKQFYEGQKEILRAIDRVNGNVSTNQLAIRTIETRLERFGELEKQVDSLKAWDRIDSIVSAAVAAVLAALGVRPGD